MYVFFREFELLVYWMPIFNEVYNMYIPCTQSQQSIKQSCSKCYNSITIIMCKTKSLKTPTKVTTTHTCNYCIHITTLYIVYMMSVYKDTCTRITFEYPCRKQP